MSKQITTIVKIAALSGAILVGLFFLQYMNQQPSLGAIENIHGIPYPATDNVMIITEPLAHADVYLNHPTLAQTATLTVTFTPPANLKELAVGIRENDFWLSYPKHVIYQQNQTPTPPPQVTATVNIPLTDKLQDRDQSLDLMFFATAENTENPQWHLHNLAFDTSFATPSPAALKDYVKSILYRERPL